MAGFLDWPSIWNLLTFNCHLLIFSFPLGKGVGTTLYENYRSFILLLLVIVPAFPLSTLWMQLLAYHSIDMWKTLRHSNRNKQYASIPTCQSWPLSTRPADPVIQIMHNIAYLRLVSWSWLGTHLYGLLTGKTPWCKQRSYWQVSQRMWYWSHILDEQIN